MIGPMSEGADSPKDPQTDGAAEQSVAAKLDAATPNEPTPPPPGAEKTQTATEERGSNRSTLIWVVGMAALLALELFIYGHNGRIQVCVGLEGITKYELLSQPRAEHPIVQYPICSERVNLGMFSRSDEAAEHALMEACTRAAGLLRQDRLECIRREQRWNRKVVKEQILPWDPRMYRRLLWLD